MPEKFDGDTPSQERQPSEEEIKKNPDLRIGKTFAESRDTWHEWARAVDRGDDEATKKASDRTAELRSEARAEWLRAALKEHGYATDAKQVWLQPYKTIGWGAEGSIQGGIPQQDVVEGAPVQVNVEDVDWSGAAIGSARTYDVHVTVPGTRSSAFLLRSRE